MLKNVFDQDHVAIGQRLVHILGDANFAERIPGGVADGIFLGSGPVAITGDTDEVERRIERHVAGQVAEKDGCTFQNAKKMTDCP